MGHFRSIRSKLPDLPLRSLSQLQCKVAKSKSSLRICDYLAIAEMVSQVIARHQLDTFDHRFSYEELKSYLENSRAFAARKSPPGGIERGIAQSG